MGHDGPVSDQSPSSVPTTDPLDLVALDIERHVASDGWDQPHRLFALVPTEELLREEPQLVDQDNLADLAPGALSAIEQEGLPATSALESTLARVAWPDTVTGVALAIERIVVPPEAERDLPSRPEEAVDHLAEHPNRQDVRLVVAVTRDGRACCLLRQRAHDRDDRVARGSDIAPGLVAALRATFDD